MAKSIYDMTDEEIMSMEFPPEADDNKEDKQDTEPEPEDVKDTQDSSSGSDEDNQFDHEDKNDQVKEDNAQVEPDDKNMSSDNDKSDKNDTLNQDDDKKDEPEDKADTASSGSISGSKEVNKVNDKQVDDKNNSTNILDKNSDIEVNYEDFYKKVMAPFKANGKTISLKNADEAIQLMQMGANYTRKMQSIAPYRKTLMMLEKAQLLDEDKLSYAIDLLNGNQEAIKKLLKDTKVDPLEFNTEDNVNYQPGLNNRVSDAEVNFKSALDDLVSTADGLNTVKEINTNWDEESKGELWKEPRLMNIIHQQKMAGIYDQIADEVNRRKVLGIIPSNIPFIYAYNQVGQEMAQQRQAQSQSKNRGPIAVRPAMTKTDNGINNAARVKAAAPTRTTPKSVKPLINPLAMSDEEFMAKYGDKY